MAYLGIPPFGGKTSRTVTERVATAGQTTFYPDGGYIPGYLDVFFNGTQLNSTEFTADNSQSVVLTSPCAVGDELRFISYTLSLSPNSTYKRVTFTATQGQTTFSTQYVIGFVDVYINGLKQVINSDFTASNGSDIVLNIPANAGDILDVVVAAGIVTGGSSGGGSQVSSSAYGWFMQ